MPFAEDPSAYLDDFGVPCSGPAGVPFVALFNQPDVLAQLGDVSAISRTYEIVFATTAITLRRQDPVVVEGANYTVREAARQLGDGLFSSCILTKV